MSRGGRVKQGKKRAGDLSLLSGCHNCPTYVAPHMTHRENIRIYTYIYLTADQCFRGGWLEWNFTSVRVTLLLTVSIYINK
jgi:hypothetical protein